MLGGTPRRPPSPGQPGPRRRWARASFVFCRMPALHLSIGWGKRGDCCGCHPFHASRMAETQDPWLDDAGRWVWLDGGRGRRREKRGSQQGGVVGPVYAYMHTGTTGASPCCQLIGTWWRGGSSRRLGKDGGRPSRQPRPWEARKHNHSKRFLFTAILILTPACTPNHRQGWRSPQAGCSGAASPPTRTSSSAWRRPRRAFVSGRTRDGVGRAWLGLGVGEARRAAGS